MGRSDLLPSTQRREGGREGEKEKEETRETTEGKMAEAEEMY